MPNHRRLALLLAERDTRLTTLCQRYQSTVTALCASHSQRQIKMSDGAARALKALIEALEVENELYKMERRETVECLTDNEEGDCGCELCTIETTRPSTTKPWTLRYVAAAIWHKLTTSAVSAS